MKVHKQERSGVVVLTLRGDFDSFVTAAFMQEVEAIHGSGMHRLVLNMRFVKFISSTALGAMLKVRKQCLASDGNMLVSNPGTTVREAVESLHLEHLFVMVESDDEAIVALGGSLATDEAGDDDHGTGARGSRSL